MAEESTNILAARVRDTVGRLGLDEGQAAHYFGVNKTTLAHWLAGDREPSTAVGRLLDVLGLLEALAPGLHAGLIVKPEPKRPRGRPKKVDKP